MAAVHPIEISYTFHTDAGEKHVFSIALDPLTMEQIDSHDYDPPEWTRLALHQCPHCPLSPVEGAACPVGLSLVELVDKCGRIISYADMEVSVESAERTVTKRCSAQRALSSLLGLKMATSGCPTMSFLKPMARFHQPFASRHETLFRAASAYLLAQYYRNNKGAGYDISLQGLQEIYNQIHEINMNMARRLRTIAQGDAHLNALILLDIFAQELPTAIDEKLRELEHLFARYDEVHAGV